MANNASKLLACIQMAVAAISIVAGGAMAFYAEVVRGDKLHEIAHLQIVGFALVSVGLGLGFTVRFGRTFGPWPVAADAPAAEQPTPDAPARKTLPPSRSGVPLNYRCEGNDSIWEFDGTPAGYACSLSFLLSLLMPALTYVLFLGLTIPGLLTGQEIRWHDLLGGVALWVGLWFVASLLLIAPFNFPGIFARTSVRIGGGRLTCRRRGLIFRSAQELELSKVRDIRRSSGGVMVSGGTEVMHITTPFTASENEDFVHAIVDAVAAARAC